MYYAGGTAYAPAYRTLRDLMRDRRRSLSEFPPDVREAMKACMDYVTPTKKELQDGEWVTVLDVQPTAT